MYTMTRHKDTLPASYADLLKTKHAIVYTMTRGKDTLPASYADLLKTKHSCSFPEANSVVSAVNMQSNLEGELLVFRFSYVRNDGWLVQMVQYAGSVRQGKRICSVLPSCSGPLKETHYPCRGLISRPHHIRLTC